ncbi:MULTISPECIES: MFS transporter [Anoxybacillus]|jgi:MFS family permease|uniref:MFS family permease n=2 Tax=Anoxybacillus TaxID=150247 RepID=A0A7X0DBC2_9BACL|nr:MULTISPECIES: MFS transporter [Anoxybacillus]ASA97406.1 MFS transporter [Anoxybacillus flavithermus]EPZ37209.1 major facilitator superfamily protein [Anoxybacillus ayderensis]MBB5355693.1 MFS family permease [Anoxybacillus mongoliensis]MBB6176974.1 MFS family permease [Anoxybacillus tengchongensis]MBE2905456.1 MFS transporter [Anoxybacillus flavithermus]
MKLLVSQYSKIKKVVHSQPWSAPFLGALFLDSFGSGLTMPFLVLFFLKTSGLSLEQVGQMLSISALAGLLAIPVCGVIVDRLGAKPAALASFWLRGIGTLGYLIFHNIWGLTIAATIVVWGQRAWPVVNQTIISQLVSSENRTMWFGSSRSLRNLGNSLGMLIGTGIIAIFNTPFAYGTLIFIDAFSFLIAAVLIAKIPLRNQSIIKKEPISKKVWAIRFSYDSNLMRFLVAVAPMTFMYVVLVFAMPAFIKEISPDLSWISGLLFTVNSLSVIVLQVPLLFFTHRLNDLQKIIVGSVVLGLSYIIFLGSTFLASAHLNFFVPLLFVGILLFSCGEQLFYPASATIVGEIGPAEKRGKSISSYQLLYGISNAIGPFIVGYLLTRNISFCWLFFVVLAFVGVFLQCMLLPNIIEQSRSRESTIL